MLVIIARGPHLITFNHNRKITEQHYTTEATRFVHLHVFPVNIYLDRAFALFPHDMTLCVHHVHDTLVSL